MATSGSTSHSEWTVGALVFSGRPDPTWPLSDAAGEGLLARWEAMGHWDGPVPQPPVLGYRGAWLRDPTGRSWLAFGGAVTLSEEGTSVTRRDEGRNLERELLASAPPGTLPDVVTAGLGP
jgi:hypothetical protein